jgi:F0F1-type ATP synthase membrane subunit b/b'
MLEALSLTPIDAVMIPIGSVLMFFLWRALEKSVFIKFLTLNEAREAKTTGALEKASFDQATAETIESENEAKRAEARFQAMKQKNDFLTTIRTQAAALVEKAESEGQAFLKISREDIEKEVKTFEQALRSQTVAITKDVSAKLLGAE